MVGSSIYHIGSQIGNFNQNQELGYLSQAMYDARFLAMSRMEAEAEALGADGVVGRSPDLQGLRVGTRPGRVHGDRNRRQGGVGLLQDAGGKALHVRPQWTGLLEADQGRAMRRSAWSWARCVYHVAHQGFRQALSQLGKNAEMANYTQAIYEAREIAMDRMQYEAIQLQAEGVVGVRIDEVQYYWGSHVIEYFSVGTAVRRLDAEKPIPEPQLTLPVNT